MGRILPAIAMACAWTCAAAAEPHPRAAEIQAYMAEHPFDSVALQMTAELSESSLNLNQRGYEAYSQRRLAAALDLFKQAILEDDRNSMAYYNAACVMALQYPALPERDRGAMEMAILRFLYQAVERHWYWALQMMVDGDLDAVRVIRHAGPGSMDGLRHALSEDYEYGSVYNVLSNEGIAVNLSSRGSDPQGGSGWFCLFGDRVFEYIPMATSRIGFPPETNVTYAIRIEEFTPTPVLR